MTELAEYPYIADYADIAAGMPNQWSLAANSSHSRLLNWCGGRLISSIADRLNTTAPSRPPQVAAIGWVSRNEISIGPIL